MKRALLPLMMILATGCPSDGEDTGETNRIDDVLALTGDAANGSSIYASRCVSCHAADGTGGIGPSLVDYVPGASDTDILDVVIEGEGTMPSAGDLEDQELADLLAHLNAEFGS
ncbi:MAG: cytochrome c [Myxococcota bacterium]